MPIRFHLDMPARRVLLIGEDPITDDDLLQYQLALAAHPDHGPGFDQLADMRAVRALEVTAVGVRQAGLLSERFRVHVEGTKLAIVASDEVTFGMARMLSAYTSAGVEVGVFRAIELAREWLGRSEPQSEVTRA